MEYTEKNCSEILKRNNTFIIDEHELFGDEFIGYQLLCYQFVGYIIQSEIQFRSIIGGYSISEIWFSKASKLRKTFLTIRNGKTLFIWLWICQG